MSRKGFFKGAIIGGAIAGTLALLFAPKAGEQTRKDLAKKAKVVGDKLAKQLDTFRKSNLVKKNPELINKAEVLRGKLADRAEQYSRASKRVTKTAASETVRLIEEGKNLLEDLKTMQQGFARKGTKLTKKAAKSAQKIMNQAKKEFVTMPAQKKAKR